MKPFFLLLIVFVLVLAATRIFRSESDLMLAGRLALSALLLFTALGHFLYPKGMALMLPEFVPFRTALIYGTGMIEIAAALCIWIPALRVLTGWLLLVFLVLILPANIYAAFRQLNYQTGQYNGPGLAYLWFRIPFQLLLLCWTYYFVIR
ncbi:DoxX family protein [Niabella terrae]